MRELRQLLQPIRQRRPRNAERRTERFERLRPEERFADDQECPRVRNDVERACDRTVAVRAVAAPVGSRPASGADLAGGFAVWTLAVAGISTVPLRGLVRAAVSKVRPFNTSSRLHSRKYKSSYACNISLVMHVT